MRIGIFDSGVGGLTVLREIHEALPQVDIVYIGDTARVPYGNKSKETIVRYSVELSNFLLGRGADVIVVACNTASSYSLEILEDRLSVPVMGVIEPGVRAALKLTKNRKVGVIGTLSTVNSNVYQKLLKKQGVDVVAKACPLFVPLVEEGLLKGKVAESVIEHYLSNLKSSGIDTLILGCTHYPLLKGLIGNFLEGVSVVDSASVIAQDLKDWIGNHGERGDLEIFFTDISPNLKELVRLIVGKDVGFQLADLEAIKTST